MQNALYCPTCGQHLGWRDEIFLFEKSECVAGCSHCLKNVDPAEWAEYWQHPLEWE